ncbi:hypothetical protein NFI96_014102 [Prochilodus magdalenae]|nr:hypothetical protein NFI96_014102 [Prochilodus magdalenae]
MFCWGDASRAQLLVPGAEGFLTKPAFVNSCGGDIVSVSCGEQHTLLVAEDGRVFSCGRNSKGQLGRAKSKETKVPVIEGLGGVASVACGQEHSLALCDSGQVFSWGGGGEGQLGISSPVAKSTKPGPVYVPSPLPIPVIQIACGNFHSLALTNGGEVYSWGQNNYGQLGLGKAVALQAIPALVQSLTGVPVIQISAGGAHTFALTSTAQVFCCGANNAGQLGLKRTDDKGRFTVCAIPALRSVPITSISCGAEHTAVLTKDGEVYTFGDGTHGQLGHNSTNRELLPRKVEDIEGPAKQVTCGSHHTLVLMPSGILFAFGQGVKGQLGNGSTEDSLRPVRLEGPWISSGAAIDREMRISSGWNSNFLFFSPPRTSMLGEPIGKLDDARVQRWLSVLERDRHTEEAIREVKLTFSTSSNLVACFMKDSGAVGRSNPGSVVVDLEYASQTFDKLLKIPWIKKAVEINFPPLVHQLWNAAPVMKCPDIFLLLPTCPILQESQNVTELVLPLAVAIRDLNDSAIKTLKEYWSCMEAPMMSKHLCMWKYALAFLLKTNMMLTFIPRVKAVLEVLKHLYKVSVPRRNDITSNKRASASRKVPLSEFYIEEIGTFPLLLQQDVTLWRQIKWKQVMATHSFIHNSVRSGLLFQNVYAEAPPPIIMLKLRRTALLEDTFRQLSNTDHENFKKDLLVQFVEDSKQTEVNKRDFFLHAFNELIAPESEMFMYNDTQTMIWFPSQPKVEAKQYFLLGILCGLALNNSNIVHMPFPLAMFKKLVNVKPTLDDVVEFRPTIGKGMRCLLYDYTKDVIDNLDATFCVHWDGVDVELDSQEKGKPVTSANKKEFVDAYVDYIMNKSVERVFEEFRRGFYKVCDRDVVEFFQPEELRGVMVGTEEYDWHIFRQNTVYDGLYHVRHPTIITFWEVFEELTEEQRKAFLSALINPSRAGSPQSAADSLYSLHIEMFCYWGDEVKPGFGLVKADGVKKTSSGVFFCSPKSSIRRVAPGKGLVGFVRGEGNVSVISVPPAGGLQRDRLKSLQLKHKIRLMSCGETQAVLLTYAGKMWWMDQRKNCRPIKELSSSNVIQVVCGNQHCMALTNDGQLFTWGQNFKGQLGLGKGKPSLLSPQPIKSLCGIPLAQISAGGHHSFALSLSGAVFGWGRNNAGQLGLGDTEDRYTPACVNSLSLKKTVFISCGEEHTATLSKGGTVFTFGSGRYGQLGHNSFRDEHRPRVVGGLWGSKVSQITCGRHHTLVLVESSKTIYSFGCGEQGQLGNGQRTNQCVPIPVHLPPEANHNKSVEQIVAGGNHSFVLCSRQEADSNSGHPESTRGRGILTLGDRMINRWISECESNQWRTIKTEIKTVFSSAACLNASFIKKSCDGHYQTSTSFSGLDVESVRAAFERLAEKEKVLMEVEKIVEKSLLPSLDSTGVGAEALRVYLILPELLRVLNKPMHETKLTAELACAIVKLAPPMLQALENYWSELPDSFLKPLVEIFRKPATHIISQRTYGQAKSLDEHLQSSAHVLQMLYKVSCSGKRDITPSDFFIDEINFLMEILQSVNYMGIYCFPDPAVALANKQCLEDTLWLLKSSACIFNLEAKCNLLKMRQVGVCFRMELRRTALLEDCFRQLKAANELELKGWLQVVYSEKDEKTDVNKRDFFHKAVCTLLTPESRMFMYNDTKTLIWFPVEPSLEEENYYLFGSLCGLAFYNNCVVNLPFPLALFKKLLGIQPSLEDLTELSPVVGRSLQYILDYSDEDVDHMDMSFTIMWDDMEVELDPEEPGKVVTSSNKKEFVDAYVDYTMNKSVKRVFEEFRRGFYKVCAQDMVEFFQPEELRGVMVGSEEYDWSALKKNATYEGLFYEGHSTIVSFWEVFDGLSDKDKKAFLLFVTGFDRVPILGMDQVKMRVRPLLCSTEDHLPQALTCHSLLELPMYQTKQTLKAKLMEALHHKRGFWEE